jgi:hypothetical protein
MIHGTPQKTIHHTKRHTTHDTPHTTYNDTQRLEYDTQTTCKTTHKTTRTSPAASLYDASKRGYPDVTIFGHLFETIDGGSLRLVDGTSASAPALGGVITLYNDARLRKGLPPLGFLNPLLYKLRAAHPVCMSVLSISDTVFLDCL